MGFTVEGFNQAKSQMLSDFTKAIADADTLRKDAARDSGDGCTMAPAIAPEKSTNTGASAETPLAAVDRPGIQVDKVK